MLYKGDYTIDADGVVGKGSFGTVHVGSNKDGVKIAAKRIDKRDEAKVAQAAQHLSNLLKLHHRNLAQVLGVHHEEKVVWVFMEFCDKGDLLEYF